MKDNTYETEDQAMNPEIEYADIIKEEPDIGIWGYRRYLYIREHNIPLYFELLSKWKLCEYLVDIDRQAEDMFFDLMDKLVEQDGIAEQLKEENPMLWVQKMNAIRLAAEEIVNAEWIRKM